MGYIKQYQGRGFFETEFDGIKGIKVKRCFLDRLVWSPMEGKMIVDVWEENDIKINDIKHLKNWVKKYSQERTIINYDEIISFFKEE